MESDDETYDIEDEYNDESYSRDICSLYKELTFLDLINQLEIFGYDNRKVRNNYKAYDHYKQIFHFSLVKEYNIGSIFRNDQIPQDFYQYNSIRITKDSDIDSLVFLIYSNIIHTREVLCFFVDFQGIKNKYNWHTTLLIYRPDSKLLEHYDSNGIHRHGDIDKFSQIIEILKDRIEGLVFVSSVVLHSFTELEIDYACSRSINRICGLVDKSNPGWCQIWSLFMYEMIVKYPHMRTKDFINILYNSLKGGSLGNAAYKALNIIKGYYIILVYRTNTFIEDRRIHISFETLECFDPIHVINDIALKKLIDDTMCNRLLSIFF